MKPKGLPRRQVPPPPPDHSRGFVSLHAQKKKVKGQSRRHGCDSGSLKSERGAFGVKRRGHGANILADSLGPGRWRASPMKTRLSRQGRRWREEITRSKRIGDAFISSFISLFLLKGSRPDRKSLLRAAAGSRPLARPASRRRSINGSVLSGPFGGWRGGATLAD